MKLLAALVCCAVAGWPSSLAAQRLITAADLPSLSAPPPDHRIPYGPGPLQFANLRLPKGQGPHPVVIFIHGGCWLNQYNIDHAGQLEQAIADAGYAVWSLEYRRVGDQGGGWPGTFTDIGLGADHLRQVASRFALDLRRVIASGHSAGGQFALWLAGRAKIPTTSELFVQDPLPVGAVLALAPAPDLEGLYASGVCNKVIERLMGGSPAERAERYQAASPMRLAPIPVPQALVIGVRDQSWKPIGRAYYDHALAQGDTQVRVVEAPESGHFEMVVPTTSTWPLVLESLRVLFAGMERR